MRIMPLKFRLISATLVAFVLMPLLPALPIANAQDQQTQLYFGSEPLANEQTKGRNFAACSAGWYNFLTAATGYQSATDYWRDFTLLSSHYADVANVENQLNKARYAVMARFMKCDLKELDAATTAYYKLEAELYFVRHYVTTEFGLAHVRILDSDERTIFQNEYMQYVKSIKDSGDPVQDELLFSAYFDQFIGKYEKRGKGYRSFSADDVYKQLGDKVDELIEGFKSFGKLGSELKELGSDVAADVKEAAVAAKEAAKATVDAAKMVWNSPGAALSAAARSVANRFQICPESASDPANCQGLGDIIADDPDQILKRLSLSPEKKTFSEVMVTITQQQRKRAQYLSQGELYARYELLYGQVSGEGNAKLLERLTTLNDMVKDTKPLKKVETCARTVEERECK